MNSAEDIPITNSTTPEKPCGLTSLLPIFSMSCRGRAEAFARRLQSRLRTLGTQSLDEITNEEDPIVQTSNHGQAWISSSFDSQVTSVQPLRQISHEADSFFDFDCEPESPGSPADECEYSRLIETNSVTPNDCASESGYICSSPNNESHDNSPNSSDGTFFDPESSETDQKSLPTDYFDCEDSKTDDTLNTTVILNGHYDHNIHNDNESTSSESLPPSQESTSTNTTATPSSLTFNVDTTPSSDSTLQDIILNELQTSQFVEPDEKPLNLIEETVTKEEKYRNCNGHSEVLNDTNKSEINSEQLTTKEICSASECTSDSSGSAIKRLVPITQITESSPTKESKPINDILETKQSSVNKTQHLSYGDTDDEDYCRPERVRRSSSLKTGKTPPGTPGRKKIVRFADVLGLDLADIKTFLDEVPTIPKSAYEDLEIPEPEPIQLGPKVDKILMPLFQQPGGLTTFLDIVRDKLVSLENAIVSDPYNLTVSGCARVRNLDFHKSVYIRYSLDNWKSYADLQANYIENSCDGFSDKFSFILFGNSLVVGQKLEFAIRFHCKGQQYWDNNYGLNYCFQCLPSSNLNAIRTPQLNSNTNNFNTILDQTMNTWCTSFY